MPLSEDMIRALYNRGGKDEGGIPNAKDLTNEEAGYFDSKVGGTARSSTGRTYRKPDGYARYMADQSVPYYRA